MKRLAFILTLLSGAVLFAQAPAVPKPHPTGYKPLTPEKRAHYRALDKVKHGDRILRAAKNLALPAAFDVRVRSPLPIWDQGQCGSCYLVSTVRVMTDAGIQVAFGKPDGSFMMSAQYGMDSPRDFGGCGGGNGTEVVDWATKNGWIAERWVDQSGVSHNDYPAYEANSGRDRTAPGAKVWVKGWTWGMVNNSGSPSVDEIKAAMFLHGRLNVALDAGGQFGNGTGTITSMGDSIDHEICMIGWDDAKDGGCFLLENQWGKDWGVDGCRWVTYKAASHIVDHFWVSAGVIPPPPPPVPPGPVPPSPAPGGVPSVSSPLSAAGVVGQPFTYQVTATNNPLLFWAVGLPDGLTCSTAGAVTGTPTVTGTSQVLLGAVNTAGFGTATLALSVTSTPVKPVTLVLTNDQVASVLDQYGAIKVNKEMTLKQLLDILDKQGKPCTDCGKSSIEADVEQLKKTTNLLLKAVLPPEKKAP